MLERKFFNNNDENKGTKFSAPLLFFPFNWILVTAIVLLLLCDQLIITRPFQVKYCYRMNSCFICKSQFILQALENVRTASQFQVFFSTPELLILNFSLFERTLKNYHQHRLANWRLKFNICLFMDERSVDAKFRLFSSNP